MIGLNVYILSVVISNRKYKQWPVYRIICWVAGVVFATIAVAGPLAERAHVDFTAHMLGHLLLGMLAPFLMVLAAPMTLLLRTINVSLARRLTRLLKSLPIRIVTNPIVASLLNVGGLWILYTSDLYKIMHENIILHVIIHVHVFLAGYVFTISMIYIDTTPHRTSYVYRSIVLVLTLAAHGILSKYIYVNPPTGVFPAQAEIGGMLMYYGGDAIDMMIIFILCLQWYKASRPRISTNLGYYSFRRS
ncbi:cytochrome c oxidase assembly protein [Alkalihalobacillus deserti]|uniref:cytochrome c oxidase assembly protein n=1 Tax=Alkalihalobacillus deserti TaxID=2879466 RepID=UPI0035587400